ncbi:MAG: ferritin-like domain-containing protein [Opitutaceae bacterium]|nr:ferritin-like domain-containing protein [Opitutaceae bacterium]
MVAPSRSDLAPAAGSTGGRLAAVQEMARLQRLLFEVEREFIRTATTLIYRVGEPELKYLLCQHVWESAGHARFLRERGRELTGFSGGEDVRDALRQVFDEAVLPADGGMALAGFYRVLKPALLRAYRHYLDVTDHLADWPSKKLVEEFILDEERHAREITPYLLSGDATDAWAAHLSAIVASRGGFLGESAPAPLPAGFAWESAARCYTHPLTCNRGRYPTCSSVFSFDPAETPIVRPWLVDPATDARVIRIMVYVWLMMEMDAVDYLATVFYDTPAAPFDLHHDLARHLWDESRHSQFGFRQLPKLGVDLMTVEHSLDLYHILIHMPPHERYAMMTMEFEAGSFPTKATVMDRIRELNDFEADTLLAFDRNDEQNHVRYGHRWLPEIMALAGEHRPVDEFVRATQEKFKVLAELHGGRTPHALPPERRLTGEKIVRLVGAR